MGCPLKVVLVSGLLAGLLFLSFLVGGLYPVLLAAFSPVSPESEILRVKAWVYTAPLWLHLLQTTALVLEGLPGTSTSLLPSVTAGYSAFAPRAARVDIRCPLCGYLKGGLTLAAAITEVSSRQKDLHRCKSCSRRPTERRFK